MWPNLLKPQTKNSLHLKMFESIAVTVPALVKYVCRVVCGWTAASDENVYSLHTLLL